MANESILISEVIPASPRRIFSAWLDSAEHSAFTGSQASVVPAIGGEHTAWDGYVQGRTLELHDGARIVQSWRTSEFPADSPDSRVEITLEPTVGGTLMTLLHTDIPSGQSDRYREGWQEYYLSRMKTYFAEAGDLSDDDSEDPTIPLGRVPSAFARDITSDDTSDGASDFKRTDVTTRVSNADAALIVEEDDEPTQETTRAAIELAAKKSAASIKAAATRGKSQTTVKKAVKLARSAANSAAKFATKLANKFSGKSSPRAAAKKPSKKPSRKASQKRSTKPALSAKARSKVLSAKRAGGKSASSAKSKSKSKTKAAAKRTAPKRASASRKKVSKKVRR